MFTSNDQSRKKFIENTRLERENRENERIRKIQEEKELLAVVMIQSWWKRTYQQRKALSESWAWWDALMETAESFSIFDIYQAVGLYCSLSKKATTNKIQPTRLKGIVKCLTTNKFRNPVSNKVIPFYTLLIDMRYMSQSTKYLEMLINHCIKQCTSSNDITNFGPELTFLLQYLNPKTYQTKHDIDPSHVIDIPDKVLQSIAQSTLKRTLCQHNVRDALIACVQQIIKLEDRLKTSSEDTAKINTMKLWLTTMTRLTLYPIEHAEVSSDSLDIQTASNFLSTNTLAVPGLTALINNAMAERLGKWVLISARPYLFISNGRLDNYTAQLSGNGSLFVLANVVDLCRGQREDPMRLTKLVRSFLDVIQPYFSDRQSSQFPHYHPIFKWSKAAWGNQLPSAVFDKVMKQMEYVWSRSFIDWIFVDIIQFDQTTTTNQLEKNCNNNGGELALFSIEMEFVFSMYVRLSSLFKAHRKVIFYRIAFTSRLMPQLWKLMNCFGPKGNMVIYLDAAKRQEIDHEPLVQVLKVFCEACSIVFLTLDNVDIFLQKKPFSPTDLIQISSFLNSFYFTLISQQHSTAELPPAAAAFKSARRLLLQIYDLDLHHPFCPANHWLLVSSMSTGLKSFFSNLLLNDNDNISSSNKLFLTNLRMGDPVPLRILQLMPHTVSFDTRLKIFRDWIALDRSVVPKTTQRFITVRRNHILEDGFSQLAGLPASSWKGTVRVCFVNELGIDEIGIDQGGPFKDFMTMLISEAFEPNYGLFSSTKLNHFYPSATSSVHGRNHIQLFEFIGKAIGKAVYEGILLDVQFAEFLLARLLGRNVFLEELKELDEEVWRNLTFIKHYEGDVEDLCLTFEANEDVLGKIESHELKFRGKSTTVVNSNRVEYVYLMADYKLNQRAKEQTKAFIHGFRTVVSESWIKLFSPPELQRVLSGEDTDFDINDLRGNTQYENAYFDYHPVIRLFWQILGEFSSAEKRAFLKFTTGCPKPPLGGFAYLQPPFTIRMVSTDASSANVDGVKLVKSFFRLNLNKSGRLPSSSTCFNLLKLPAYTKKSLLKEKLSYAINSNAGFELS